MLTHSILTCSTIEYQYWDTLKIKPVVFDMMLFWNTQSNLSLPKTPETAPH